ncbi:hypothetical protein CEP77_03845 [Helicobacter pylori]|nr:hypothetical protein CEP77_01895 [Helicobacter pylori]AVV96814.1 hypothetical protein CEP77_03845 [Helicobacter pylori]
MTWSIVSSGIQSMVNGAYLFFNDAFCFLMMRFYLILMMRLIFKALFFSPPFQSLPHHFQ